MIKLYFWLTILNHLENKEIDKNSGLQYLKIHLVSLFLLLNVCLGFSSKFLIIFSAVSRWFDSFSLYCI